MPVILKRILEGSQDSLISNSLFLIVGAVVTSALGMLFWILATKLFDPADVGIASALISGLGLVMIFSNLGLGITLIRYLPPSRGEQVAMINASSTYAGLASIALGMLFVLLSWSMILPLRSTVSHPFMVILIICFSAVWTISYIASCVFIGMRSSRLVFYHSLMTGMLRFPLLILLFFVIGDDELSIFLAAGLGSGISLIMTLSFLVPIAVSGYKPRLTLDYSTLRKIGFYSAENYVARMFLDLVPMVLPLLVMSTLGAEKTAYYSIAWSIAAALLIVPVSVFNSLFAEGALNPALLSKHVRKSVMLVLLILTPAVTLLGVLGKPVLLLFGEGYAEGGYILLLLLGISMFPYSLNYLEITIARIDGKLRSLTIPVATCLLTLSLSLLLGSGNGLVGIGVGILMGQSLVALAIPLIRLCRLQIGA